MICLTLFASALYLHLHPQSLDHLFAITRGFLPMGALDSQEEPIPPLESPTDTKVRGIPKSSVSPKTTPFRTKAYPLALAHTDPWTTRERELREMAMDIEKQRQEIETKILYLEKVRDQLSHLLKKPALSQEAKIKKLVHFYSYMKPQNAAQIIGALDENLAVAILEQMKKLHAAKIVSEMEPQKVQKISEKLARISYKGP